MKRISKKNAFTNPNEISADDSHILIIPMGGTICTFVNDDGIRLTDCKGALARLTEHFHLTSSLASRLSFKIKALSKEVLSENVTVSVWNELLKAFKDDDVFTPSCKGVILLHGTDTLAYTSSFLSAALEGTPVPVFTVAAQLPLEKDGSNGYVNFKAAAELIINGIAPNVYSVYRNVEADEVTPTELLLHLGRELIQCEAPDCNFHSKSETALNGTDALNLELAPCKAKGFMLERLNELKDGVLLLRPYPGLNYSSIDLRGITAVVHGTYHSGTVCVDDEKSPFSIIGFLKKLKEAEIPLLLCPVDSRSCAYESAHVAIKNGAFVVGGLSLEHAYAKTVLATSLGLKNERIKRFLTGDGDFL